MATEAQKRASENYRKKHLDYYCKKSGDYVKKVRMERNMYKERCEKATEIIQYIIDYGFDYDGFNTVETLKGLIDMLVDYARKGRDILRGCDKE